jgi:hypothetical protein
VNQSTAVSALLPTIAATLCGVLPVGVLPVRGQDIPLELRGTVVSEETGRPLAGALVSIGPSSPPAVSETDGSYVIRAQQRSLNHPAGVQAFLPGYLPEERFEVLACHWIVLQGEGNPVCAVRLNFLMRPAPQVDGGSAACSVSGRVVMEETLAPAQVMVTVDGTKTGTLSNSEGRYMLLNVPAGLQRVTASSIGLITERRSVVVSCGPGADPVTVSFTMRPRPLTDLE